MKPIRIYAGDTDSSMWSNNYYIWEQIRQLCRWWWLLGRLLVRVTLRLYYIQSYTTNLQLLQTFTRLRRARSHARFSSGAVSMTLLHTFNLSNHDLRIYDTIDPDMVEPGHVSATTSMNQAYYSGVGCRTTPCYFQTSGGSCIATLTTFIRSNLISTNPEYFI